jgi:uncharacterized membrane protein required for colicin V production
VDIVEFIQGLNLFDLLVVFFVAGFFVVGYIQGTLRRALGLAIALVSFLIALNLRAPLGAWLSQYWTQLPQAYVYMVALGGSFLVIFVAGSITAQVFYRKTTIFTKATVVDELVGGVLGAIQALLLVSALIITLDSYYAQSGVSTNPNELGILGDIYAFYNASHVVELFRSSLIPLFFALFGWIVPPDLAEMYS